MKITADEETLKKKIYMGSESSIIVYLIPNNFHQKQSEIFNKYYLVMKYDLSYSEHSEVGYGMINRRDEYY